MCVLFRSFWRFGRPHINLVGIVHLHSITRVDVPVCQEPYITSTQGHDLRRVVRIVEWAFKSKHARRPHIHRLWLKFRLICCVIDYSHVLCFRGTRLTLNYITAVVQGSRKQIVGNPCSDRLFRNVITLERKTKAGRLRIYFTNDTTINTSHITNYRPHVNS